MAFPVRLSLWGKKDTAYSKGEEESDACVKGKRLFGPEEEDLNRE